MPVKIFFCYAHEDEAHLKQLKSHLRPLQRKGLIEVWHDGDISAGEEWEQEIKEQLNTAHIILLLISPNFMDSDYCYGIEMQRAIERHERGEAKVIPVILRASMWKEAPFGKLQVLPRNGKPISGGGWHNRDEAFHSVANGISKVVVELTSRPSIVLPSQSTEPSHSASPIFIPIFDGPSEHASSPQSIVPQKPSEPSLLYPIYKSKTESTKVKSVLIIDDAENIVELIKLGLKYEGFRVEVAANGPDGLVAAQRLNPDLVILDMMLPGMDGLEVCRQLRSNPITQDVPILMLTAKDEIQDRITGLEVGADDYLTKPFSFDELVARIHAVLRRQRRSTSELGDEGKQNQILQCGDLEMNTATRKVTRAGRMIELTPTEYNLLHLFMSHPRQVLDRLTIINRVWGYDFQGETNIIEVYVRYLREKLEDSPSKPRLIQTVRGVGFVLKC